MSLNSFTVDISESDLYHVYWKEHQTIIQLFFNDPNNFLDKEFEMFCAPMITGE